MTGKNNLWSDFNNPRHAHAHPIRTSSSSFSSEVCLIGAMNGVSTRNRKMTFCEAAAAASIPMKTSTSSSISNEPCNEKQKNSGMFPFFKLFNKHKDYNSCDHSILSMQHQSQLKIIRNNDCKHDSSTNGIKQKKKLKKKNEEKEIMRRFTEIDLDGDGIVSGIYIAPSYICIMNWIIPIFNVVQFSIVILSYYSHHLFSIIIVQSAI